MLSDASLYFIPSDRTHIGDKTRVFLNQSNNHTNKNVSMGNSGMNVAIDTFLEVHLTALKCVLPLRSIVGHTSRLLDTTSTTTTATAQSQI